MGAQFLNICELELSMSTPLACPKKRFNSFWFLMWLIWMFFLYITSGYIINSKIMDKTGIDAFPHVKFWREFPGYVNVSSYLIFRKESLSVLNLSGV